MIPIKVDDLSICLCISAMVCKLSNQIWQLNVKRRERTQEREGGFKFRCSLGQRSWTEVPKNVIMICPTAASQELIKICTPIWHDQPLRRLEVSHPMQGGGVRRWSCFISCRDMRSTECCSRFICFKLYILGK